VISTLNFWKFSQNTKCSKWLKRGEESRSLVNKNLEKFLHHIMSNFIQNLYTMKEYRHDCYTCPIWKSTIIYSIN
jgi:hypothetical protein